MYVPLAFIVFFFVAGAWQALTARSILDRGGVGLLIASLAAALCLVAGLIARSQQRAEVSAAPKSGGKEDWREEVDAKLPRWPGGPRP
jgi:hypothetical protein